MIHPAHQLNIPQNYLKTLSTNNISYQYSISQKSPTVGLFQKIKMWVRPKKYYEQLLNFYPYHHVIKASNQIYEQQCESAWAKGIFISGALIALIHQLGRRGVVLPLLTKYGKVFHSHRVFRHYLWALVLPTAILQLILRENHFENVNQLWNVHARRLHHRILSDPAGSEYPDNVLDLQFSSWATNYTYRRDLRDKFAQQGRPLQQSQLYANPEFETVDFGEAADQEQEQPAEQQ